MPWKTLIGLLPKNNARATALSPSNTPQINPATNIANTDFDKPDHPVAPKGILDPTITPVAWIAKRWPLS